MRSMMASAFVLAVLTAACAPTEEMTSNSAAAENSEDRLAAAVAAPSRSAENVERDQYRNPAETLAFFGVQPDDMVVEIWPGGGWYSEILAPYTQADGSLALYASERGLARMRAKAEAEPSVYTNVLFSLASSPSDLGTIPEGSADVVLTFRNVHNWAMGDEPYADVMFGTMYRMLRPGGTLGVVDHRLPEDRPDADMKSSGYMKQSTVISLAEAAGFELVDTSEINANPRDTADHEAGVWTLPPTLRTGDESKRAIGESDRMTLKFRKPE
nr:methyltransferase domain-containing protein [Sphingomicrobium marinum]